MAGNAVGYRRRAKHGEVAMVGAVRWTATHVFGLLLVGRQMVSTVAPLMLSGAVLSAAAVRLRAVRTASSGTVRLPAVGGTLRLSAVTAQVITLRPWCFSYHWRSSGSQ